MIGIDVVPQPFVRIDPISGQVLETYLPEFLDVSKRYRITHIMKSGWGLLVKTDRFNKWININWFSVV